jgi:Cd2+/Zn2+-exporting ATPase
MIKKHISEVKCLHCPTCSGNLEESMLEIEGIEDIKINYATSMMNVSFDSEIISLDEIKALLDRQGCQLLEHEMEEEEKVFSLGNREFLFALLSGIFMALGLITGYLTSDLFLIRILDFHDFILSELFFVIAIFFGGFHVARSAFKGLLNKRFKIDSLMLIGAGGAVFLNAFAEGAAVLFLFSVAELLEDYSVERSRGSLRELVDLTPKTALVKRAGSFRRLPVEVIMAGEVIKVKPGERIGVDGTVIKGNSAVNQAPITGEPMPVAKASGDTVFSGTINTTGILQVKASRPASDSTLAKIVRMVEAAEEQKSPTERFIDRFAKYYTPSVVGLAVMVVIIPTFSFAQPFDVWFYKALLLLLISCPCALALSTPIAIATGITNGAKNGVLFKGGVHIEKLPEINTFAFDKTGTLTTGRPEVADILIGNPTTQKKLLGITASLEHQSTHPIGKAIVEMAEAKKIKLKEVEDFRDVPGKGITGLIGGVRYYAGSERLFSESVLKKWQAKLEKLEGQGKTIVIVGTDKKILGVLGIADKIRPSSKAVIDSLHRQGISRTVMITGDNARTAGSVAAQIGIDEYHAELLPDQKVELVKQLGAGKERSVAMVGDGVNDAPALAGADIGIAMGAAGSDTALEVADIALMNDDISKVPYLLALGRKTMSVVKQNIILAIGIKLMFAILVFPGLVTLWMAVAIGDMGVSLGVILNAFRITRTKE